MRFRKRTVIKIALASALIILAVVSAVDYLSIFYRISFPWERSNLISSDVEIHFGLPVQAHDWKPDDSRIMYGYEGLLWTTNPDGSNKVRLYQLEIEELSGTYGIRLAPDGKKIVFANETYGEVDPTTFYRPRYFNIYTINIDGTNLVKLTNSNDSWEPSWSPNGERIVFIRIILEGKESDILVMNADGTEPRQLTSLPGEELDPVYSPDGNRIGFVHRVIVDNKVKDTVYVMNADGSGQAVVPLGSRLTYVNGLSWGPDSSVIVASDGEDIWAFTIDGRVVRRIIATWEEDWNPLVSHDGKRIVYETFQPGSWGVMNLHVATLSKPLSYENLAKCSSALPTPFLPPPFVVFGGMIVIITVFAVVILGTVVVWFKLVKKAAGKKQGKITKRDGILMSVSMNGSSISCFSS